ncbi:MAG: 2Fe-2S iron-sulfur cluster-binding protein [Rhizobiaceae bacterium]
MARFFPLVVTDIQHETREAVAITLEPPAEHRDVFRYLQGQYLTFRYEHEGEELRRNYSISTGVDENRLRIGVKRVDGGAFSNWANTQLKRGDILEAMPPEGKFNAELMPDEARTYLMFAGGSGITPVLGLIKTILAREPRSAITLVYANRTVNSIMFREELEDLKNLNLGRFSILHVIENDTQEMDLFTGRVDEDKLTRLFKGGWIDLESVDLAFICGPEPMMLAISQALQQQGMAKENIRFELFKTALRRNGPAPQAGNGKAAQSGKRCELVVTLDGVTKVLDIPASGMSVLEAAMQADMDAPHSCRAGVCSTCRAKVVEGEFELEANYALEDYEIEQGYVLTCQCMPLSDRLVVDYDQH